MLESLSPPAMYSTTRMIRKILLGLLLTIVTLAASGILYNNCCSGRIDAEVLREADVKIHSMVTAKRSSIA